MTLQQLEYVVALDKARHFVNAAEMCGVTQPTLSAMVQKLEDELDCKIFDRSLHPIAPTELGALIIKQANVVLFNANQLKEIVSNTRSTLSGDLSLAMIPTIAPYLLPKFLSEFRASQNNIKLKITEMRTESIIKALHKAEIDMAILSTPLNDPNLLEVPLYYEQFVAYVSPKEAIYAQTELSPIELPMDLIWVLEEGHCFRNQVFNFCDKKLDSSLYEAGSIETLVKIVDVNGGYTIIPELHVALLNDEQRKNVRNIVQPMSAREVSLVVRFDYVKEGMMNAVADLVKCIIPQHMLDERLKKFAIKI